MPFSDKEHQREYARKHYSDNKHRYLESNKRRRQQLKNLVRDMKSSTACADCKQNYPHYVMDFDHLRDKKFLISKFVTNNNRTGLMAEIAKCDIVCSNCHRERFYKRL